MSSLEKTIVRVDGVVFTVDGDGYLHTPDIGLIGHEEECLEIGNDLNKLLEIVWAESA